MKYPDGKEVLLGDKVELWEGNKGVVVGDLDKAQYSSGYAKEDWEYLGSGILVTSQQAGLTHYRAPEKTMRLLSRLGEE